MRYLTFEEIFKLMNQPDSDLSSIFEDDKDCQDNFKLNVTNDYDDGDNDQKFFPAFLLHSAAQIYGELVQMHFQPFALMFARNQICFTIVVNQFNIL